MLQILCTRRLVTKDWAFQPCLQNIPELAECGCPLVSNPFYLLLTIAAPEKEDCGKQQ
jgi:hypothetical protein